MKKIFQRNHIIITVLVVMIAVAGYLNFSHSKKEADRIEEAMMEEPMNYDLSEEDLANEDDLENGEAEEVSIMDDQGSLLQEEKEETKKKKTEGTEKEAEAEETGKTQAGEAVLVSNTINGDFFASAKLSREQTRAKNKETLMGLVDDKSIDEAQKQQALDEVIRMTDYAEKESAAEILLESKGFGNAVVTMADSGVDVIVEAQGLTRQHIAQIQDIVKRKTGVSMEDIVINPVALE